MVWKGRKVKEVFTIEGKYTGKYGEDSIDDYRTMIGYESMDEAIKHAKLLEKAYKGKKGYKNFTALVCFNEWEYESGDIYGNRTCLSLKDLGVNGKRK